MEQNEIICPVEIMFPEWKFNWDWIKIIIYHFQSGETKKFGGREYWLFLGKVLTPNNPLIENGALCRFHLSKFMLRNELKKHIHLHTYPWNIPFDITFEMKRLSMKSLILRNVTVTISNCPNKEGMERIEGMEWNGRNGMEWYGMERTQISSNNSSNNSSNKPTED